MPVGRAVADGLARSDGALHRRGGARRPRGADAWRQDGRPRAAARAARERIVGHVARGRMRAAYRGARAAGARAWRTRGDAVRSALHVLVDELTPEDLARALRDHGQRVISV